MRLRTIITRQMVKEFIKELPEALTYDCPYGSATSATYGGDGEVLTIHHRTCGGNHWDLDCRTNVLDYDGRAQGFADGSRFLRHYSQWSEIEVLETSNPNIMFKAGPYLVFRMPSGTHKIMGEIHNPETYLTTRWNGKIGNYNGHNVPEVVMDGLDDYFATYYGEDVTAKGLNPRGYAEAVLVGSRQLLVAEGLEHKLLHYYDGQWNVAHVVRQDYNTSVYDVYKLVREIDRVKYKVSTRNEEEIELPVIEI